VVELALKLGSVTEELATPAFIEQDLQIVALGAEDTFDQPLVRQVL
jgi:hypothetical protein